MKIELTNKEALGFDELIIACEGDLDKAMLNTKGVTYNRIENGLVIDIKEEYMLETLNIVSKYIDLMLPTAKALIKAYMLFMSEAQAVDAKWCVPVNDSE